MTAKKALLAGACLLAISCLCFAIILMPTPSPAVSHAGYAWKPGCHCGAPKTTTTKKPATTTTKRPATTTPKRPATTTTRRAATATTKRPVATTTTTAQASTTTSQTTTTTTTLSGLPVGLAAASIAGPPDSGASGPPADPSATSAAAAGAADAAAGDAAGDAALGDPAAGGAVAAVGDLTADETAAAELSPPHYFVSPVAIIFLLIYAVSFILYRTRSIRVQTHRKIWNALLLLTFLITGTLGLILAIGVSQDPPWLLPRQLLFWHVETGVLMSFISFFHLGWHLKYYLALVTGRRRQRVMDWEPARPQDAWRGQGQGGPARVRADDDR